MKKKKVLIFILLAFVAVAISAGAVYYFAVRLPEMKEKEAQQQAFKALYAELLGQYAEENTQYYPLQMDVAFLGDSLTAGYDVKSHYPEYAVTNRAIGGETTHSLKARLAVSVLELQPKVCVMLIGGNNPDTMFDDYEDMLITFREEMPETKIILVSHAPTSGSNQDKQNEKFVCNNARIKLLAEKYGYEYVDLYSPMLDPETGEMNEKYTIDGVHFTLSGYDVYTAQLKPVIDRLLQPSINILHAGGGWDGLSYLNARETFAYYYDLGYRYFEYDLMLSSDGRLIGTHCFEHLPVYDPQISYADFSALKLANGMTPINEEWLVETIRTHPDVKIVVDAKMETTEQDAAVLQRIEALEELYGLDLSDNIIPEIFSIEMWELVRESTSFNSYFFSHYKEYYSVDTMLEHFSAPEFIGVAVPAWTDNYIKRNLYKVKQAGKMLFVFTVTNESEMAFAKEIGADGIYINQPDSAKIED